MDVSKSVTSAKEDDDELDESELCRIKEFLEETVSSFINIKIILRYYNCIYSKYTKYTIHTKINMYFDLFEC